MTSQNFSSKRLSLDSLKVRERCGLISLAAHRRELSGRRTNIRDVEMDRIANATTETEEHEGIEITKEMIEAGLNEYALFD